MIEETISALHTLNTHPATTITVLTGSGRFFAAGADVNNIASAPVSFQNDAEKKIFWLQRFAVGVELVHAMIEHKKVFVLAMNGPGVGAGAAWFQGVADLFYMAEDAWIQVTFSQLGLVPENGSAIGFAQHVGVRRANEMLMLGEKIGARELVGMGMVNRTFPKEGFHESVQGYLVGLLKERDGKSMMEMKRLQNARTRDAKVLALFESWQALSERFVEGEPLRRMGAKMEELAGECEFYMLMEDEN